ncbi:hypothetical protein ACEWY4_006499 [Coilia grayii]|uniref:Uncharacterized protein n=1 Tax=Coilia grayii TaxID=363190 RepID=A0ABD1KDT7_9TELE
MDVGHEQGDEAHTEDGLERSLEEGEQEEPSEHDLQLHIADDDEPCGKGNREEEHDRPNPVADMLKSSGSSSFTEITLTEVKEEEGSSPRSITPQIDSPDLEEEEEDGSTVQSLMTQTSSHTTIGQFDFYQPDPFTDNDLFRDDLFPKVEVTDSTDGFFSDPFKGTDPFASDYLFNRFEEEQYLPSEHLPDIEHETKPELEPVPECTTNMNNSHTDGMDDVGDKHLLAKEQFNGTAANLSVEGLETREECDGFEISAPACSEYIHANNSPSDVAEQSANLTHFEPSYTPKPGHLEPRDANPLSADLSDEKEQKSEGHEFNSSCPLNTNTNTDNEGQGKPTECALSSPRASEGDRYDPSGSEGSGSPLGDPVNRSITEAKRQVRRHFSCDTNMALSIVSPDNTPGHQEAFCPEGDDINGWQPEDAEVCDENSINVEFSQRTRGSSVPPKFTDQEVIGWNLSSNRNCDGCVFELCHHYPTSAETLDTLRANGDDSEYRDCDTSNSQADKTANCNAGHCEHVEQHPLSPQINEYAKYDIDQTRKNHNLYSPDLTSSGKQEVCESQYRYVDPFSPEQNDDIPINFGEVKDMEHNILVPISIAVESSDARCIELKTGDPFSPDGVVPIGSSANCQQITNLDPCHFDQNAVFMYDSVGSKHTDCEFLSSEPSVRTSWDSSGSELRDPEASTSQYSDECPKSPQKNSHTSNFGNVTHNHSFNSESEDLVCHISESKHKPIIDPETSDFRGLKSLSPEPTSDSDGCHPREYDSGCYDTGRTVSSDLRPPELMQFDPFSPEPSDAEMCDVGSESNHCSYSAFFETASNVPSRFSSWGLEPSMFTSESSHGSEQVERCEYTPTGTSSDDSVRGHPFDSESSETAGWSLSECELNRATDQNLEDAREKATTGSDISDQDGCCSELNRVARSSRHSSVPDSIAEMLFGPEPSSARFYPWDIENSNTIVCDNHSPEDSPDTLRSDFGSVSGYDINSSVAVNSGASEVPNLR